MSKSTIPFAQRFWAKVQIIDDENSCWPWLGATEYGYGRFVTQRIRIAGQRRTKELREQAHRIAYRLIFGAIAEGDQILHTCDNPPCCRPKHLYAGTHDDNMRDKVLRNRQSKRESHGMAKLRESDIALIRASAAPSRALGREFNVSHVLILKIKSFKLWK